jgi:hypothetical protein
VSVFVATSLTVTVDVAPGIVMIRALDDGTVDAPIAYPMATPMTTIVTYIISRAIVAPH